ncbi:hypothetical protein BgAZ_209240 [Babesia gibsoni]|uniref:Transcription factor 25 n=1 Tax=Babesia gibsoni TaxID=33632 RepID=A0AAD8PEV0_BABGI|nr:hypothetical protein BgAZ_209240 [Babesia gibsoni]
MSTRQIRRLKQALAETEEEDEESLPSASPVIVNSRATSRFERFKAVLYSSDSSDEDYDSGNSLDSEDDDSVENATEFTPSEPIARSSNGTKGHKAIRNKNKEESVSDSDSDIDALLAETRQQKYSSQYLEKVKFKRNFDFLRIDPRSFRLTGIPHRNNLKKKGAEGFHHSRNWLVPWTGPVAPERLTPHVLNQMKVTSHVDQDSKRELFTVETSKRYKEAESLCHDAINMQNTELLLQTYRANEQHVEILLRISCIQTLQGQHEEAFSLLVFAAKLLQLYIPLRFSPFRLNEQGYYNTWLPSTVKENLVVYRLLILYMISLERQGEWEVALAVCKLLLLMDFPRDGAHALLHIDMYMINNPGNKLHEFSMAYARELKLDVALHWLLPNLAFSLALDYYSKEESHFMSLPLSGSDFDDLQQFLLLKEDDLGFSFNASQQDLNPYRQRRAQLLLLRALLKYPDMLELLSKQSYAPELLTYTYSEPFSNWINSGNVEDVELVKFYLAKTGDLWRNENLTFLSRTANLIMEIYATDRGCVLLDAFRDLWLAFRLDTKLPFDVEDVIVAEFDLSSHSLPMNIQ